jgi:hypothetical protein
MPEYDWGRLHGASSEDACLPACLLQAVTRAKKYTEESKTWRMATVTATLLQLNSAQLCPFCYPHFLRKSGSAGSFFGPFFLFLALRLFLELPF